MAGCTAGTAGAALETELKPCAAASPASVASNSRPSSGSVEARIDVMARDFIAAPANLLCGVSRRVLRSPAARTAGVTGHDAISKKRARTHLSPPLLVSAVRGVGLVSQLNSLDQPHFESPQFRQVMQPSIMTTAAVLHLRHSCAPTG